MAAYFAFGVEPRHILTAVIMTAPGDDPAVQDAGPRDRQARDPGHGAPADERPDANVLDAASRGTREGLQLALNIAAMLIAFLGLIALINKGLGFVGHARSQAHLRPGVLAPVAYLLGVPWADCPAVGGLLGTRTVLNELIAFGELGELKAQDSGPRSFTIATFALCGFANFSSIGIQLGGIGALAPDRRARPGPARASGPCSRGRWPTSSRPASRGSCYDMTLDLHRPRRRGRRRHPRARRRAARDRRRAGFGPGRAGRAAGRPRDRSPTPRSRTSRGRRSPAIAGNLVVGLARGGAVAVLQGRFHDYEGHDLDGGHLPRPRPPAPGGRDPDPDRGHRRDPRRPPAGRPRLPVRPPQPDRREPAPGPERRPPRARGSPT